MKSCSRVPTASTTSASAASALAEALPITPSGPALLGWSWGRTARPAMVSTTGTRWVSANVGELGGRERIVHAAARDDQRLVGLAQELGRRDQLLDVGPRPRHAPDLRLEEALGVVERLGLGVLAQAEEGRAAVGRVEHGRDRLRQRADDLLGPGDPVPVAGHRP